MYGILVHGFWRAYAVHHYVWDVVFADVGQHFRIKQPARNVVDEVGTLAHAGFGHVFPERVDGNQGFGKGFSDGFQYRDDTL